MRQDAAAEFLNKTTDQFGLTRRSLRNMNLGLNIVAETDPI